MNHWRSNSQKLTRRKAIRAYAREHLRTNPHARAVYDWAHAKIRRFYDVVPLGDVWRIGRTTP